MKPVPLFSVGIGLFAALSAVTGWWWLEYGRLQQSYVFVMIPTSAIAVICIFGGFLGVLRRDIHAIGPRIDTLETRTAALETQMRYVLTFLAERHGRATGFVEAVAGADGKPGAASHFLKESSGEWPVLS